MNDQISDITENDLIEREAERVKKEQNAGGDEIDTAIASSKIKEEHKKKRKKQFKYGAIGGVAALVAYGLWLLFKPFEFSMTYGVCRVFLELNVQYPQSLRMSTVEDMGMNIRIWYTQVDSFGEYRLEPIHCYYRPDETTGLALEKVTINRREVDPAVIRRFNSSIPSILAYPPELVYPTPLPDSLRDLQINTDAMRKPIL
jgi:hypothetical protein